ncbi:MAG: hypothetical protein IPL61_18740 [Myxococcales bacterium]|nr:hypothetical protein [Myxococcales bacterium]
MLDPRPVAPGVYRRKAGGYHVRARWTDGRTGRKFEVRRVVPQAKRPHDAAAWLAAEIDRVKARNGTTAPAELPRFADYAATIFDREVAEGRIASAAGREKWSTILRAHLVPAFGDLFVDRIVSADVEAWKGTYGRRIRAGEAKPATGNTILSVLRVVTAAAADEFDLRDPMRRVRPFDTRGHRTYTDDSPNSLAPADLPRFLAAMRSRFPGRYAITLLGFVTGLRPSSLRPLRRRGPSPDLDLEAGVLLVRQSHTRRCEVMPATKTGRDQRIRLPAELVTVLRDHVAALTGRAAASDPAVPEHHRRVPAGRGPGQALRRVRRGDRPGLPGDPAGDAPHDAGPGAGGRRVRRGDPGDLGPRHRDDAAALLDRPRP